MANRIDLNADLGEGLPTDADLMPYISSCNIACGGHAGNSDTMRMALRLASEHGVFAGAHPSYPDRASFGRQSLDMDLEELSAALIDQIGTLSYLAKKAGVALTHLKPHGALYHDAARSNKLAHLIVSCALELGPSIAIFGPPEGALKDAYQAKGLRYVAEGFADRTYQTDGTLTPRATEGAVILDQQNRVAQALQIVQQNTVTAVTGVQIPLHVQTLCLHGDSEGAAASAKAIHEALTSQNVAIKAPWA